MKIYIVEIHDYDSYDSVGYFTDYEKANKCCEFLNRTRPSEYEEFEWYVSEYYQNNTNYAFFIDKLNEEEKVEYETRMERIKQEELAELARLKAKYEV